MGYRRIQGYWVQQLLEEVSFAVKHGELTKGEAPFADLYNQRINELHAYNPLKLAEARKILQRKARDNTRTPMPWNSSSPNAGFCEPSTQPWMRLNDDFPTVNVEAQTTPLSFSSKPSVFAFWKSILKFRKEHKDALVYGDFALIGSQDADDDIIAYRRFSGAEIIVVLINLSGQLLEWQVPETLTLSHWEFGNYPKLAEGEEKPITGKIPLRAWEGVQGFAVSSSV
jgi:oligo-1,6-glucosidase